MNSGFFAFMKKEWLGLWRSGKLLILLIGFVLFGIMNPAVAKLTPWLMEQMAEELAESGLSVSAVHVDASASWAQFFKNMPMAVLLFAVLSGGSLTDECRRGTLIPFLTRGLSRHSIIAAKAVVITAVWTAGYWLCFGITSAYNIYFWEGGETGRAALAAVFPYLFGLWIIAMLLMFSVPSKSGTGVLACLAALIAVCFLAGVLPGVARWLPTMLLSSGALAAGQSRAQEFVRAALTAGITAVLGYGAAVAGFGRKLI